MEKTEVQYLGSNGEYQTYNPSDLSLINSYFITPNFGGQNDYVEYFIKDVNGSILAASYFDRKYKLGQDVNPVSQTTTTLTVDPETDGRSLGFDRGIYNVKYNFLRQFLISSPDVKQNFWIKEISTSRTEIKCARQDLSNQQLAQAFTEFTTFLQADVYYPDFYLNFGNDQLIIAINAVYVEENGNGYVIFKLYEPLPEQFDVKSKFWVVSEVSDPAEFNVSITVEDQPIVTSTKLQGPNYKIQINDTVNQTTPYYNYEDLFATSVTSSYQQLKSMMDEKGIMINVDYGSFDNFIRFSSITERLYNFVYKVQLIESASLGLVDVNTTTQKVLLQNQIDETIKKFDGYEYYLYFESQSTAWPKSTSVQPYNLYSVTSSQVVNWLGSPSTAPTTTAMSMYYSASIYDNMNPNLLEYSTPQYIRDDAQNVPYLVFLNMIGQHFDNLWIYLKDVTNRYSAENNPFVGISMDEVGNAIKSLGVKLYTNTSISDNIYYSLLGINADGSLLPPTGSEVITNYVTSSIATLPGDQITGEIYKRIYHNLAYLLKTRGTERGARALVTAYGIPESALTVHEYGGYDIYTLPGIQEIDNKKITTASIQQINTNLLNPFVTLQYYSNDYDRSSTNVQIGFSPADSINASITSSGYVTASNQPGYFNIMQYIGAPDLQYSSSYIPLVELGNTYFNAEYTSGYNVWDFIRIIKYYNNSIFKMLRDWVPARASADTGIVIKSHMLERNKYPRKEPTGTTSSYDADYQLLIVSGSDGGSIIGTTAYVEGIPVQYQSNSVYLGNAFGTVYMSSSDDIQKYTGEFSGSTIYTDVNYFPQTDYSNYAYPWTSSVAPSQHGGQNILFQTYSLSPLFENVTGSTISQRFLDLDYNSTQFTPVNFGLVTQSLALSLVIGPVSQSIQPYSQYAQLQDFNYASIPSVMNKYSGSRLSGLYYNTYSFNDVSYGREPVINWNTNKLGLFTQVATSSFLPGRVNATLGYLADVSGGLFELNQNNKNWQDVQNTFKAGTILTIKQFDNKKYSNQKSTDGVKSIYNSGYSYSPQLYFVSGVDTKLYFQYVGESTVSTFTATNSLTPDAYISGAGYPAYPVTMSNNVTRAGNIYRIFDIANPSTNYTASTYTSFPTYSIDQAGQKTFTVSLPITIQFQDPSANPAASGSYEFGVYQNDTLIGAVQTINFTSSYVVGGYTTGSITTFSTSPTPTGTPTFVQAVGKYTGPFNWTIQGFGTTTIGDINSQLTASVYSYVEGGTPKQGIMIQNMTADLVSAGLVKYNSISPSLITSAGSLSSGGTLIPGTSTFTSTQTISYTTPATSFSPGDLVNFRFRQGGMSTSNFTSSLGTGQLTVNNISVALGGYPYATSSLGNFIYSITNQGTLQSEIQFSQNLSQYIGYLFVPYFESGSVSISSSLYQQYGDTNYPFYPQPGDKLVLADNSSITQEVDVFTTGSNSGRYSIIVSPKVLDNWVLNPNLVTKVLILRRYNDEQNVILTFNKTPGQTSYGFLIPNTVSQVVLNNINTLQAAVQSQLLSTQANSNP